MTSNPEQSAANLAFEAKIALAAETFRR